MNNGENYPRTTLRPRPRGIAIIELFVGLGVISVALTIGLLAFEQSLVARRFRDRRDAARELVTLSLERARALEATALPQDGATLELGVPRQLQSRLPGGSCVLSFADSPSPELKRIHIEVRCRGLSAPETGEETVAVASNKGAKP
jgi:hypothetical protein